MATPPRTLTIADHAILAACRVWPGDAGSPPWECFAPAWRDALRDGWAAVSELEPDALRRRLREEHEAEARPDLSRVHPSWWIRALKDESPAVRRAVAAHAPRAIREPIRTGLGLSDQDLQADRPPRPEALGVALALWSERLVGDWPERDDPPVIVALTRHDLRDVARLIHAAGLAKCALIGMLPRGLRRRDQDWARGFQALAAELPARFAQQSRRDVATHGGAGRHALGRVGLVTIARLLDEAEPYRVRWALQHLPYPVAKFLRTLMGPRGGRDPDLAAWEGRVFGAARDRLRDQRRLRGGDERGGGS